MPEGPEIRIAADEIAAAIAGRVLIATANPVLFAIRPSAKISSAGGVIISVQRARK
jgi:hypothetical protein